MTQTIAEALDAYRAWVVARDPETALRTWDRVTLEATGTSGRRERAASINALKRAIERLFAARLVLESREYSETSGFLHATYLTYRIERPG